jgi:hypothetical protein
MDSFSPLVTSNMTTHILEIFTANLIIQGNSTGPFLRASDLVNRKDRDHITVDSARITPMGRQANPTPLATPLIVARPHVHLVSLPPQPDVDYISGTLSSGTLSSGSLASGTLQSGSLSSGGVASGSLQTSGQPSRFRESAVRKNAVPCYILTDMFVVVGNCHLLEGTTLESLIDISDYFIAITNAAIYVNSAPATPLQREFLSINKDKIQAMYLTPSAPTAPGAATPSRRLDETSVPPSTPQGEPQS